MKIKQFIVGMSLVAPLSMAAQATFEVGGVVYTEDLSDPSKLAVIVVAKKSPMVGEGISAYEGDIVIPSTVEHDLDTYQVTGISKSAFLGSEVESLIINDGPTKILSGCINCQKLEKLVLPSTMTSISGLYVPALEEITFSDNIQTIDGCFIGGAMTEMVLPQGLKNLKGSFISMFDLSDVTFGPNVKKIEDSFIATTALKSVSLPGSLMSIKGSFSGCEGLESIELPEGLQKVDRSFTGCYNLKKLTLPNSLTVVSKSFGSPGLREVRFGTGFNNIDAVAAVYLLEKLYCPWTTPPAAPAELDLCESLTVYVPKGAAQAYVEAWGLADINKSKQCITVEEMDF